MESIEQVRLGMSMMWDFVVVRTDRTEVFFHPYYSDPDMVSLERVLLLDPEIQFAVLGGGITEKKMYAPLRFSVEHEGEDRGNVNSTCSSSVTAVAGSRYQVCFDA